MASDEKRYLQCPGCTLGAHAPNVFIERRPTKKAGSVCFDCIICQCRIFGRGQWNTAALLTADQCRAMIPPGVPAIDGRAQHLPL